MVRDQDLIHHHRQEQDLIHQEGLSLYQHRRQEQEEDRRQEAHNPIPLQDHQHHHQEHHQEEPIQRDQRQVAIIPLQQLLRIPIMLLVRMH